MKQTWTIPWGSNGKRLDHFLTEELPDTTRSQIAKLLKRGAGTVNGKPATVHHFLKTGDFVVFDPEYHPELKRKPVHTQSFTRTTPKAGTIPTVEIVEETKQWLVVNKPAGLLVHPVTGSEGTEPTLVDFLVAHDPAIAKIGEDPERPGIMHRLDKEASGLMVVAKTQNAYDDLKKQFAEHTTDKRYVALVYGEMEKEEGDIKFRIARSKTKQRMAARPEHEPVGKAAWTHFKVIEAFKNASLLEVTILSGRTHQIRAHLLAMNHPIMGDPLYSRRSEDRNIKAPRLMLQNVHLGFIDPETKEKKEFDLPPAAEFADVIKTLK